MKENYKSNHQDTFTVAGTNIDAIKRANERSGMSYNEVKELLAKTTGGRGTWIYSDTNIEEVKRKNQQSNQSEE
ncbi:gamma-type small acid-soluble spore protein [Bacillus sp. FJAT-49732]|uniref:Gamma-type small acid-soluble spore protein n=1 Tax=Lederbergia citrisecunda TaxID=2833583 RepID=A0A942YM32_9BACI|nr:gamma-type small acid-soluble spore protein [Lederbergia citrisecunda]MBS4202113.1 gamma-type small acid-soluble spore protein [Lederbergia citrisecunda]